MRGTMRTFNVKFNVGKAKYLVSYHDGIKTHKDGSPFYDGAIFSNKKKLNARVKRLIAKGYKET